MFGSSDMDEFRHQFGDLILAVKISHFDKGTRPSKRGRTFGAVDVTNKWHG